MKYKRTLIRVFNHYIRLRDSIDGDGHKGFCISCGRLAFDANWQAGHFIHNKLAVQFDEDNVNGQCKSCNKYRHGNTVNYRINLVKKIGESRVKRLERKQSNRTKIYDFIYEELIKEYRKKIKEIKK